MNLNKVFLAGNVTQDMELRYTQSGSAVGTFNIAINRKFRTQGGTGEEKEETTFVRIVLFGNIAEALKDDVVKGKNVHIEGRLRLEQWQTQDGQKREKITVVSERINLLGARKRPSEEGTGDNNES